VKNLNLVKHLKKTTKLQSLPAKYIFFYLFVVFGLHFLHTHHADSTEVNKACMLQDLQKFKAKRRKASVYCRMHAVLRFHPLAHLFCCKNICETLHTQHKTHILSWE